MNSSLLFLKSALSDKNSLASTQAIIDWVKKQNQSTTVEIQKIAFEKLKLWGFDEKLGTLRHHSGNFFSIDGIRISTNWGPINSWEQPIINQPEIGYLGFITKEFNGVLHFLMQAKIEPGNVNYVQLSPTLQATKSNYSRAHGGKAPSYLEFFLNVNPDKVLLDQLQSEQGARFLKKRNRNIIIKVDEDIPVLDNFCWLTLGQIKSLMKYDNLVNMDTRTVISGISYGTYENQVIDLMSFIHREQSPENIESKVLKSLLSNQDSLHSFDNIVSFVTRQKSFYELTVDKIALNQVSGWEITPYDIVHKERKYFKVIAVEVAIGNREVVSWTQPMIEPMQEGLCAFVCKEINGTLHFAVQAKLECGNFDIIEFAPTVQCLTGNYKDTHPSSLPFLEYVLNASSEHIVIDALQSEEGGRFFKEQNRNMIVHAGEEIPIELPSNYIWMTLNQLHTFIKFNNYINIQARSLIAALAFKKETLKDA